METELLIIGGGPGGYTAAFAAADRGMEVVLVDLRPLPGGVCLHEGCIPSKALLAAAEVVEQGRGARRMGIEFGEPAIDLDRLRAWKEGVVGRMARGLASLAQARHVRRLVGTARLLSATEAVVAGAGGEERIRFHHAILAAGSRATAPPPLAGAPGTMDAQAALALEQIWPRLLVVGAGAVGLELGGAYAALGSRVILVEQEGQLLPGVEGELVAPLARACRRQFGALHTATRVAAVREVAGGLQVVLTGAGAATVEVDRILVATGRRPNSDLLGLDTTTVALDAAGFVKTDATGRTREPTLFAIGDLTGPPLLAHRASHQAQVAVAAIGGAPTPPGAPIPAVVYTRPEIAWVGAQQPPPKGRVTHFPWSASGRGATLGDATGLTRLVWDAAGHLAGGGIAGAHAGELIAELTLALTLHATAEEIAATCHPHPTLAETVMEGAALFTGATTHLPPER